MPDFKGQLKSNEIFSSFYNMIISQMTFTNNLDGLEMELVNAYRSDGSLYGDTKLFVDTDVLRSRKWLNDAESTNLLKTERPPKPKTQSIIFNQFRQIGLTVDNYLSKRAWGTEGAFSEFISVMLGWLRNTKQVYDYTLFNTFIGTDETKEGNQSIEITLPVVANDIEATNKAQGAEIARSLSDLLIDLKRPSRKYNDNKNLKSRSDSNLIAVWNSAAVNKIEKYVLPVLFHKEDFIKKFGEYVLPSEYFGKINSGGGTASANTTIRSLVEVDYNEAGLSMDSPSYDPALHIFPGDLIPEGKTYKPNETYTVDDTILFKLIDRKSVPFMSAFEVGTSFFNSRSLTENHYLTWGYNSLEHLKALPFITVRGVKALGK